MQGNLDPALCLGTWEVAAAETRDVLGRPAPAPATSSTWATACCPRPIPGILEQVVELVHAEGRAGVETAA